MNPGITVNGRRVIKLENEIAIAHLRTGALRWISKLGSLPGLPLVFAQVLHNKGLHTLNREQPLSRGVNSEAPQVAGNPASAKFLSHGNRRATATKAIKHQVAFVGGSFDNSL